MRSRCTTITPRLAGADVVREKIDIPDRVEPGTQLVMIPFGPLKKGQSMRLRISETYTDPARYDVLDGQLMWHRSFGRPRNDMVLPAGWYLTTSSIPAVNTPATYRDLSPCPLEHRPHHPDTPPRS